MPLLETRQLEHTLQSLSDNVDPLIVLNYELLRDQINHYGLEESGGRRIAAVAGNGGGYQVYLHLIPAYERFCVISSICIPSDFDWPEELAADIRDTVPGIEQVSNPEYRALVMWSRGIEED